MDSEGAEVMSSGRSFHTLGPATGKAWLPIVECLKGGTTNRLVPAEQRACRPRRSATRPKVPRCLPMQNFVGQYGDLVDDVLRDAQPVQANERVSDMIGAP